MEDFKFIQVNFTSHFAEFKPLLGSHKEAKKALQKSTRRIKTFESKYKFIHDIIKVGSNDDILAKAIKLLLKDAGFTKVIHYNNKKQSPKREDLQAWHDNDIFIIEIKGLSTINPKNTDLIQVVPYFASNVKRHLGKNVYGLSIISHNNRVQINARTITYKEVNKDADLVNCNIGSMSAIILLLFFKDLKNGSISFEDFKNNFKKTGIINYDSKGGNTSKK